MYNGAKSPRPLTVLSVTITKFSTGHEREDVVAYRKTIYLVRLRELSARVATYSGDEMDIRDCTAIKDEVLIFHDESSFHQYGNISVY
jgi:hypothetical protein